jgi:hypothetical protein
MLELGALAQFNRTERRLDPFDLTTVGERSKPSPVIPTAVEESLTGNLDDLRL